MATGLSKPIESYPLAKPEDLPVPPPPGAPGEPVAPTAPVAAASPAETAVLEFLNPDKLKKVITLEHPFRWDGREFAEIEVRCLSVAEVGKVAGSAGAASDLYPYFAAMCGLPAAVLRALPSDDGGRLLEACAPFLPRFLAESD
jgi:hypothetical protein